MAPTSNILRVVHLNPSGQLGGAETSLLTLLASIREAGFEVALILGEDGPFRERVERLGVAVHVLPLPEGLARLGDSALSGRGRLARAAVLISGVLWAIPYVWKLASAIRRLRPSLIHTTGFKMHILGAWAKPASTPLLWHLQDYVGKRPLMRGLLAWHRRFCSLAIANSRSVARDLERQWGSRPQVVTLPNTVDVDVFAPHGPRLDLDELANLPPAPPGTVRIGLLGTFARWKGHHVFLRALSLLAADLPFRAYIIGGPIYRTGGSQFTFDELNAEVKRLGLGDRVGFTGFIGQSADALRALDVVVHCSTEPEPFGMVIIEGMSCGKAVIVSRAGGAAEIIEDGVDALCHTPGDAEELAAQIERLVRDEDLRLRLGAAGRRKVEARYARSLLQREITSLYEQQCLQSGHLTPSVAGGAE